MTAVVLADTSELTREEWLDARRHGIGGSDVAAILGLDQYKSPYSVWCDKVYGTQEEDERDPDSDPREWGKLLEPVVARKFAADTGFDVRERPLLLQHPDRPWALANVDREIAASPDVDATGVLEVKTTGWRMADRWDDGVPDYAACQGLHYLDVTGYDELYVAVLIGGNDYRSFRIARDEQLIAGVRTVVDEFWQSVVDKVPPPIDASGVTRDLLQQLYDVETPGSKVHLDEHRQDLIRLLVDRRRAMDAIKELEETKALTENRLRSLLGEHEVGLLDGKPLATWKTQHTAAYTVAARDSRVLRIKDKDFI